MMWVVRWVRGHWVGIALLTLIVAVLGLEATEAAGSPVRRGATYEGTGHQLHFPPVPLGLSGGDFVLEFRVTRNGRQVTELNFPGLHVVCTRDHRVRVPFPVIGSAQIQGGSTFRAVLRDGEAPPDAAPVELAGRFLSDGRARGTVRYRGRGPDQDCNADGTWTAHVKRLQRVQRFTGTTEQRTRVTFDRTIERHPRVTHFNFGWLRGSCGPVKVATTLATDPWWTQFALPVNHRRFSGRYVRGGFIDMSGGFDATDRASGTVSYEDRTCSTGKVHWTAHLQGRTSKHSVSASASELTR